MRYRPPTSCSVRRRGVVLLTVLIVVAILILVGYQYNHLMQAEQATVEAANRVAQSRLLAESGLDYAAFVLSQPHTLAHGTGEGLPTVFHGQPVRGRTGQPRGFFSIVAPREAGDPLPGLRFGVEDESAKINLDALVHLDKKGTRARWVLLNLPNVTEELADSLLNWVRPALMKGVKGAGNNSADVMYYGSLGYQPRQGPCQSLEELLLVRGVTPRLLLGNDRNRNGRVDPGEDDRMGLLDPGLARHLTIYSREQNVDSSGVPRIHVNDDDLSRLYEKIKTATNQDIANYVLAYRIYGPSSGSAKITEAAPGSLKKDDLDFDRGRKSAIEIRSLYDLVGSEIEIVKSGNGVRHQSPLQLGEAALRQTLPLLLDKLTTVAGIELPPRINVNTAPREVLLALPELTDEDVDRILEVRAMILADPSAGLLKQTPAWLMTEVGFEPGVLKLLEPYLTTRSQVFRVQSIGYYEANGPMTRLEAVIDTNAGRPRILYWRDLSELGAGFDPRIMPR